MQNRYTHIYIYIIHIIIIYINLFTTMYNTYNYKDTQYTVFDMKGSRRRRKRTKCEHYTHLMLNEPYRGYTIIQIGKIDLYIHI